MATLKDVAKLACVDVSTVSRALNNTSYVHPDTKARIFEAVKTLSYHPNVLAKGLRKGKRHTLGVVIPFSQLTIFADIVQSIETEARKLGYSTLLCHTEDDPEIERHSLNRLRNGFVDGIIIASTGQNGHLLRDIHASGIAVMQIIRKQEKSLSSVVADYKSCAYETVNYLVAKGCQNIGFINGNMHLAPYKGRYEGYEKALNEHSLPKYCVIANGNCNSFDYGYQSAIDLLDQNPRLDAIMAAVDIQGMAAIRVLKEKGLNVPKDVKVVSLTGHSIGGLLETSMTSQEIPAKDIGQMAVNMIVKDIDAPENEKPSVQHLVFNAVMIERESS
ncbi:MAG: LacI family DNA-binding transcriptional regulator [Clostridia bacterium]|nr:LacI family DNA-binding transcriptional regulator [Clostridia bacterium]